MDSAALIISRAETIDLPGPRLSKLSVAAFVLSLAVLTPISVAGLLLGLGAWMRHRSECMGGRAMAHLAVFLGGLSLWCQCWGYPLAMLQPPVRDADRELQSHLDEIAGGKYLDAYGDEQWPLSNDISRVDFKAWCESFNARYGKAQMIWGKSRTEWGGLQADYYVCFEKSGWHILHVTSPAPDKYVLESIDGRMIDMDDTSQSPPANSQ